MPPPAARLAEIGFVWRNHSFNRLPTTDYRLPHFGFVFPRPPAHPIRRNSLSAQHLSSVSPVPKLASFGVEALVVVTPPSVRAPAVRPIHTGRDPANWVRLCEHSSADYRLLATNYRILASFFRHRWLVPFFTTLCPQSTYPSFDPSPNWLRLAQKGGSRTPASVPGMGRSAALSAEIKMFSRQARQERQGRSSPSLGDLCVLARDVVLLIFETPSGPRKSAMRFLPTRNSFARRPPRGDIRIYYTTTRDGNQ